MVIDDKPFFIVRIEYDNQPEPQRVFLIHVDKDLITKALKRLREIDDPKSILLKKSMTYPRVEIDLVGLNGDAIKSRIVSEIGNGIFSYSHQKTQFLNSVGYEAQEFEFKVKTNDGIEPIDQMIDLALGLRKNVEIHDVKTRNKRFGTYSEYYKLGDAKLSVAAKPSSKIRLRLQTSDYYESPDLNLDLFITSGIGDLPKDKMKVLLKDNFTRIHVEFSKKGVRYDFTLPDPYSEIDILEVETSCTLLSLIAKAEELNNTLRATVYLDQKKRISFVPKLNAKIENLFIEHAKAIYSGIQLIKYFQIQNSVLKSILLIDQFKRIEFINDLVKGVENHVRLEFWSLDKLPRKKIGFIFPFEIQLQSYKLIQDIFSFNTNS